MPVAARERNEPAAAMAIAAVGQTHYQASKNER
jgi:hypothetical protein